MTAAIRRREKYCWLSYSYRYNNEDYCKKYGEWLIGKDWAEVIQTPTSNGKAELYQKEINWAIENFFPLKTTKRRSIDPPWINKSVKKLIKSRKGTFVRTGCRTAEWKAVKKKVKDLIKKRCRKFQEEQKKTLLADDGGWSFFKQTKNYLSKQRPKPFEVMDLFPSCGERKQLSNLLTTSIPYPANLDLLITLTTSPVPLTSKLRCCTHIRLPSGLRNLRSLSRW